jgi:hypothetical protein
MHFEIEAAERRYKGYLRWFKQTYLIPDIRPPQDATLELELLLAAWTRVLMRYAGAVPPFDRGMGFAKSAASVGSGRGPRSKSRTDHRGGLRVLVGRRHGRATSPRRTRLEHLVHEGPVRLGQPTRGHLGPLDN